MPSPAPSSFEIRRRPTRLAARCAALVLALAAAAPAVAAPGDLDPTFGAGGTSNLSLDSPDAQATSLAIQPDGRLLIGGETTGAGVAVDGFVARLIVPQGTLDTSYGGGAGWSPIDLGRSETVTDIAQQPDGRIVAVGSSEDAGAAGLFAARLLNPAGTFDPSFAGGVGWTRHGLLGKTFAAAVALQPDGGIVVAGSGQSSTDSTILSARFVAAGTLDPAYGGTGTGWAPLTIPPVQGGGTFSAASDVTLRPDGRILVAGITDARHTDDSLDFAVARLGTGGAPEPAFGPDGSGTTTLPQAGAADAAAMALQPDGAILVSGHAAVAGRIDAAVARFRPDGSPDPGFSGDGRAFVEAGGAGDAAAVAVQPDGRILIAGWAGPAGGPSDVLVARLLANGDPDGSFGTNGRVLIDFGGDDGALALALQPDGRIVVAGSTESALGVRHIAVARLLGDPPPAAVAAGPGGGAGPPAGGDGTPRRVLCQGRTATIVGTAGPDRLRGTRRADVIAGLGGADAIAGLGGDDLVCGGAGADRLSGGPGADTLLGQDGADRLAGGAGRDRLLGGPGADRLLGGADRDRLTGGPGRDLQAQ